MSLPRSQRLGLLVLTVWSAILAIGFTLRWRWVIGMWPWPDGRLSYIFVGSILAAVAAAALWLAVNGDRIMLAPAAANVSVMLGGLSGYLFLLQGRRDDGQLLLVGPRLRGRRDNERHHLVVGATRRHP